MRLSGGGSAPDDRSRSPIARARILRLLAVAAFAVLILSVASVAGAQCSCSLPPSQTCNDAGHGNGRCASCATQPVSCQCSTGCTTASCPSRYSEVSSSFCFVFVSNKTCRRDGTQILSSCANCVDNANEYGAYCYACPGCNGRGTCHGGVSGDGLCTCNAGSTG